MPTLFLSTDITNPWYTDDRGCAGKRGPSARSELGTKRRVRQDEVSVNGADSFRDADGSGEMLAHTSNATSLESWTANHRTVVFLLPVPAGTTELNVGSLTVTGYGVGYGIAAPEAVAIVR